MYGWYILCGISKVPFEIPHKISHPYIKRCVFYWDVKIQELLDLRAHKCFWNAPLGKQITRISPILRSLLPRDCGVPLLFETTHNHQHKYIVIQRETWWHSIWSLINRFSIIEVTCWDLDNTNMATLQK